MAIDVAEGAAVGVAEASALLVSMLMCVVLLALSLLAWSLLVLLALLVQMELHVRMM